MLASQQLTAGANSDPAMLPSFDSTHVAPPLDFFVAFHLHGDVPDISPDRKRTKLGYTGIKEKPFRVS